MNRVLASLLAVAVLALIAGCGNPDDGDTDASPRASSSTVEFDQELHDELVAMAEQDQEERTGGATMNDEPRTERLKEIIEEHGWPTIDLVGEEGEDAAWVIAQHSDLDPEFQAEALELLRAAVEEGQASPGNLAYLVDRVRAGRGEPQVYGTQMGCSRSGEPLEPEIEDRENLEERREEAGLPSFEDYLEEMAEACSAG